MTAPQLKVVAEQTYPYERGNERICFRCGKWKPLEAFYKRKNGRPRVPCIECYMHDARRNRRKRIYAVTPEQFMDMLKAQHNACAICCEVFRDIKTTHIDHDHITGVVRGLLCDHCNLGIGHFRNNSDVLRNAIAYLEATDGGAS